MVRVIQTWYGRTQLKQSIEEITAHLRIFRDERGNELLDLPDAPLPSGDTPAPLRPRLPQPGALPRRQGMCDLRRAPQEGLPLGGQGHVPDRRFRAGRIEGRGERRRSLSNPSSACPGVTVPSSAKRASVSCAFWRNRSVQEITTSGSRSRPRREPAVQPRNGRDL